MFALDAPEGVEATGRYISWRAVEDAVEYEVLVDGTVQATTEELFYMLPDQNKDSKVTIQALAEGGKKRSKPSAEVKVYQNSQFLEEEILNIEMVPGEVQYIPASVRCVYVTGIASDARIMIQDRQEDLVVRMRDTVIVAPEGQSCITSETVLSCAVYLSVEGNVKLSVAPVTTVPATPADNSGQTGKTGTSGGDAVCLNNLILCGDGELTLQGGDGGRGGKGSTAKGILTTATSQNGGNGGAGGNGIRCTKLILAMNRMDQRVHVSGGVGGAGGAHGDITVSISGAVTGVMGVLKDGQKGADGTGVSNNFLYNYRGVLEK